MHACAHMHSHTHTHTHTHTRTRIHTHTHARTYTHTHIKYTKAYADLITRYTLQAGNLGQLLHNQFILIAITLTMSATLLLCCFVSRLFGVSAGESQNGTDQNKK